MKITNLLVAVLALSLTSGCVHFKSDNLAGDVKPLPFKEGEKAVYEKEVTHIDANGKTTKDIEKISKTGLEVNSEQNNHKLQVAESVGVARAKGNSGGGFWANLFAPSPYTTYGGYGGGYYLTSGGGGGNYNTVWRSQ
ncbi:MAG: hypothetical protein WAV09_03520 [Minisyncoccia bacterium]